ncbi:uncharacterized protein LOC108903656 [Anoplophora glabripennis]|uniref:uncharacterized protein LOC108903656 n=1 Tax=Anoplophora glabripennis TaxID=217634 RepID=UPI00087374E8|nr:uncharacterized protein LOC108903656 [Anoplophora glabripennis]
MTLEVSNCCGFSLKNGTIIIGVLQSVVAFMFLVLSSAYAENPHELLDMSDPSIVPDLTVLRSILIVIAIGSALQCLFSIMIIFGAVTNHPTLLLPWLILNPIALIVYLIGTFIAIIHHTGLNNTPFIVGHLVVGLAVTLIVCYKVLVVHNFFRHLKSLNF